MGWLVVFFVVFVLFNDAGQAVTQLDDTFGENGFLVKDFGSGEDEIFALVPQADGKIIVVGEYDNGAVKNLAVARYLPTGELDKDFNNDGVFTHSIGTGDTRARSLAVQGDGKIVVAGSAVDNGANTIALIRLTADGYPDNSFADNGQLLLPGTGGEGNASAVKVAADGAIFVAGTIMKDTGAETSGIVVKLTAEGQYDDNFGEAGISVVRYDYNSELRAMSIQPDGKIVVVGSFASSGTAEAGLLRFNENGSVDEQFGESGQFIVPLEGSGSIIHDVTVDPGGRLFVVGEVNNGSYRETFVAGITADGTVNADFGSSAIYRSTLEAENVGQAITFDDNGNLLIVGSATTDQGKDIFLLTLAINNEPTGGNTISATYITADLAGTNDVGNTLAAMSDGSVFVAGSTGMSGSTDFALLRFTGGNILNAQAGPVSGAEGVSTAGYTVVTKPVTDVTRVSAVSGGIITDFGTGLCVNACTVSCSNDPDFATCFDTCFPTCELPSVILRGVVFGIAEDPVFDETEEDTTEPPTDTENPIFPESETFVYETVQSGQTEDGSGVGSFGSIIDEITPNTVYYVRAYAVLSDDTVIYGNNVIFKTEDACFIATAAYGSMLERHVLILREFRDRVMMASSIGKRLVGMYYGVSPGIAGFIAEYEVLRTVVRVILLPIILLAYFILKTSAVTKLCLLTAGIGLWSVKSIRTQT